MGAFIRLIKLFIFRHKWKKNNSHNTTTPKRIFDINKVRVGRFTYGQLNIFSYGAKNELLTIGDFVSIASNVKFILGGNHRTDTFSSYPFKVKLMNEANEALSKGPIVVEDDVWIGIDCIILSGVRIGQGAVIGAGTVVSKDIPPYAIVTGNPARVVKYRFDEKTREMLTQFDYSNLNEDKIKKKINLLYRQMNNDIIDEIMDISEK